MQIHVRGILLRFTNYQNEIEIDGSTVREGLMGLMGRHPDIKSVLTDREGCIRPTHLIVHNGEQLSLSHLDRPVAPEDRIDIVTAVSGG